MSFEIRYLGSANDKHWFLAKEYLVCLSASERSCDCMWGTMQESRGKKSNCKHCKTALRLLEVIKK